MATLKVKQYGSPVLREVAQPVEEIDDEIRNIVKDMIDTMYASEGIGLAAPQIGISKRIIVVDVNPSDVTSKPLVLINPVILDRQGSVEAEEGCLSIPEIRGNVKRYQSVVVEGLNLEGQKVRIEATDLLARVLQHEIDHLDGKFFVDHLSKLKQMTLKNKLNKIAEESERS